LPPEPGVPVHTAWDIGHRHSTAIWFFQVVGPEVRIIDFYGNHGQYADHYCSVVSARGYLQGKDYVPHDARVHEWGTGKTRIETLIALGRKPALVPDHKVEDGVNAAHLMFKRVWFDETRCASGLRLFGNTGSTMTKKPERSKKRRKRTGRATRPTPSVTWPWRGKR
jgi:phage terminase large subunit